MKKIVSLFAVLIGFESYAQILYKEDFQNVSCTSYGAFVPTGMIQINNDGYSNYATPGNSPFDQPAFSMTGWAVKEKGYGAKTAVSTGIISNWGNNIDRWLITPPISGLTASAMLSWVSNSAYSGAGYSANYEVWVSVAAGASSNPTVSNFTSLSTNKLLTVVNDSTVPASHKVSLAAFANQTVRVAFRNYGQSFQLLLDNIMVNNSASKDVEVKKAMATEKYYQSSGIDTISANITNWGNTTLNTVNLKYSINGGTPVAQTFSPGINYSESYTAVFSSLANLNANGLKTIKVWVSGINGGGPDTNPQNDSAATYVTILATPPVKKVLVEEYTGAWCGFCPDGATAMEWMLANDTNLIVAAIHGSAGGDPNTDLMALTEGNMLADDYTLGFPNWGFDRTNDYEPSAYMPLSREAAIVPAKVSFSQVNYNPVSRLVTADVKVTFVESVRGNFALNCYATENYVYGPLGVDTWNGYNQHSYFYNDASSPFYQLGYRSDSINYPNSSYMRPFEYKHKHVVESFMGGAYGDYSVIPTNVIPAGTTFTKTFSYTLPAANPGGAHRYNADNIHLIGMVQEYSYENDFIYYPYALWNYSKDRYVLNSCTQKLTANPEDAGVGIEIIAANFGEVAIFPNPAINEVNIDVDMKTEQNICMLIYNSTGELVQDFGSVHYVPGLNKKKIDTDNFKSGVYTLIIKGEKDIISRKIIILR